MNATDTPADLQRSWGWFMLLGFVMIAGGLMALYAPFAASLAVEMIVGAAFLAGGIVSLIQIFRTRDGWSARAVYFVLGLFNVLAGVVLLFRPLEGLMALTLVLIGAIFVNGLMRTIVGFQSKPVDGWGWLVAGGILYILVAAYFTTQYPEISVMLLGIFAGVSLIGDGAGYLRFAYGLKTGENIDIR